MDIALFEKRVPKVFVEAKRLDRDYDPDYKAQLDKYASYLDEEGIAVLTNGRFWLVHTVVNGDTQHLFTIDIDKGDPEAVAGRLNNAIGRNAIGNPNPKSALPETIAENLRKYREREAKRRNYPAYTILKDETINLIATQQPADLRQLGNIRGVGAVNYRTTWSRHHHDRSRHELNSPPDSEHTSSTPNPSITQSSGRDWRQKSTTQVTLRPAEGV